MPPELGGWWVWGGGRGSRAPGRMERAWHSVRFVAETERGGWEELVCELGNRQGTSRGSGSTRLPSSGRSSQFWNQDRKVLWRQRHDRPYWSKPHPAPFSFIKKLFLSLKTSAKDHFRLSRKYCNWDPGDGTTAENSQWPRGRNSSFRRNQALQSQS